MIAFIIYLIGFLIVWINIKIIRNRKRHLNGIKGWNAIWVSLVSSLLSWILIIIIIIMVIWDWISHSHPPKWL